jgi:hypothetical protein
MLSKFKVIIQIATMRATNHSLGGEVGAELKSLDCFGSCGTSQDGSPYSPLRAPEGRSNLV